MQNKCEIIVSNGNEYIEQGLSHPFTDEQLEKILSALALDDYFQLLSSERKGEKMYVISLRPSGYAYKRCALQRKRGAAEKVAWAIVSAVIAFAVGWVLQRIF